MTRAPDGTWHTGPPPKRLPAGEVTVLDYAGTSFFAELPRIESELPSTEEARDAVLILVVRTLPDVPSSAVLKLLDRYARSLDKAGGRLILAGAHPALVRVLKSTGLSERLGIVPATPELLGPLVAAETAGREWIAGRRGEDPAPVTE